MTINVQMHPASVKRLSDLIIEMQKTTKAEMPKVVRNTARDWVKSAIRYTPIAPKTKTIHFKYLRDADNRIIEPRRAVRIPPKKIPIFLRGFAKSGWIKAMRGLGLAPKIREFRTSMKNGHFVNGLNATEPYVEVGSRVEYINILDDGGGKTQPHHIMSKATEETIARMERTLTRMAAKLEGKWR